MFALRRSVLCVRASPVNDVYTVFISLDEGECCWVVMYLSLIFINDMI
jgi:hypothetical protein